MHIRFYPILIILLAWLVIGTVTAQDSTPPVIYPISEPTIDDQQSLVQLDVVVQDAAGLTAPDLSAANFTVSEASANLTVTPRPDLPLTLAVIVDTSFGSSDDLIRDTLRAFFDTYYRPDDTVTFYIIEGDSSASPRAVEIADSAQINETIASIRTSSRYYSIQPTLTLALEAMQAVSASPDRPRHVLFVGSLLNVPDEAAASAGFAANGIPFHVVQAHRNRQPSTSVYRTLAENGGGLFVNNLDGAFVLNGDSYTPVNLLKVLYDVIANTRIVYRVQYQTLNRSLENLRDVTLTVALNDQTRVQTDFTYEWTFLPPVVNFVDTSQLNVVRRPFRDADDLSIGFDTAEQPISVTVSFPDDVPRDLASLRLEVVEKSTGNVLQSQLELNPQPDASGIYALTWSLNDYAEPDTTTPVEIRVRVVDELDFSSEVVLDGRVRVNPAPPLPTFTPLPEPTAAPTAAATVIPPTAVVQQTAPAVTIEADDPRLLTILLGALVILVGIVLVLMVRLQRLRRMQKLLTVHTPDDLTTDAGDHYVTSNGADATPQTHIESGEVIEMPEETFLRAKMLVKQGREEIGAREVAVQREIFTIGRSAEAGCDLVINMPYISPRHCQIIVRDGQFSVRDLNTKNGTFVNGERIPRERETSVPQGSEIGVTKNIILEIWGPDMEFEFEEELYVDPKTGIPTSHSTHALSFKPLPGLRYVPDEGDPVTDDYSPL